MQIIDIPLPGLFILSNIFEKNLNNIIKSIGNISYDKLEGKREKSNRFFIKRDNKILAPYFKKLINLYPDGHPRIEICADASGSWIEPHIDISDKLSSLQIYLNNGPKTMGTCFKNNKVLQIPFIPDTGWWAIHAYEHFVHKDLITENRLSCIISWVINWKNKQELW